MVQEEKDSKWLKDLVSESNPKNEIDQQSHPAISLLTA